ncbi:MAG: hypothetical protein ACE5I3_10625 [Phycisphaerae bacterium]
MQRAIHATIWALLPSLLAATSGCKLFAAPWLMWAPEPTKLVPAEFPYLQGKRVCVVVWADPGTLYEYPFVPLEVSEHVAAAMKPSVKGVSFVPNRKVVELQRSDDDWDRKDPALLGARFGAERVLMIELTQYTTREPESPHLYRGRIAANVKVYNAQYRNSEPVFKKPVEVVYPPDSVGQWGSTDQSIRKATMEAFAAEVAGKFYDRRVKVK